MYHGNVDLLSLVHFIIYFILGLYWEKNYVIVLFIGIIWELLEKAMIENEYIKSLLVRYWPIPERYINDTLEHSVTDICINMIGYTIGSSFA